MYSQHGYVDEDFTDFFYFRSCCDFVDVKINYANLNCIHFVMFKIVIHACHRRSKAFDSLCLLLYTVMSSLNKISYLILYYLILWMK